MMRLLSLFSSPQQDEPAEPSQQLRSLFTGAIDWRREGIRHRNNRVNIDILETFNLLLSSTGTVLRNEVTGGVQMNTKLTGMPECKFALNKLAIEKEGQSSKPGVEIDEKNCTFHRCVTLGKFDADRTITFIPPDGEFELMQYRVTDNINLPFRIMPTVQEDQGLAK
jgi:AP-2 complex subunit mu-1